MRRAAKYTEQAWEIAIEFYKSSELVSIAMVGRKFHMNPTTIKEKFIELGVFDPTRRRISSNHLKKTLLGPIGRFSNLK